MEEGQHPLDYEGPARPKRSPEARGLAILLRILYVALTPFSLFTGVAFFGAALFSLAHIDAAMGAHTLIYLGFAALWGIGGIGLFYLSWRLLDAATRRAK